MEVIEYYTIIADNMAIWGGAMWYGFLFGSLASGIGWMVAILVKAFRMLAS